MSSRGIRAANRTSSDADPGTEATMRITNSPNSSFSPPIKEIGQSNRKNSLSGKKRNPIQSNQDYNNAEVQTQM